MKNPNDDLYISTSENRTQRAAMVLKSVRYVIEAHMMMKNFESPTENLGKFYAIFQRRIEDGQCYHMPYLGTREFPANFRPYEKLAIKTAYPNDDKDLGFILYDMDYSDKENIRPMFFRAKMKNGVIDVSNPEVFK